ncbi:hypothetical protein AFLA_009736 [Aspergillus flavus NRRL3357]|nr:hypothetical protein AFLA_009736 [Aspergillus flavus NRRL3357]
MGFSWYGVLLFVQLISSTIVYASDPCAQIDHYVAWGKKQGRNKISGIPGHLAYDVSSMPFRSDLAVKL